MASRDSRVTGSPALPAGSSPQPGATVNGCSVADDGSLPRQAALARRRNGERRVTGEIRGLNELISPGSER